jgi:4-hydroxy-3-methylbut-2-enyl diphosphate reductase
VKAFLVNDASEISPLWFEGIVSVGVTSGASTPEAVVHAVVLKLQGLGGASIRTLKSLDEEVWFGLPAEILQKAKEKQVRKDILEKHNISSNSRMRVGSK